MIDSDSAEFKTVVTEFVRTIKTLDTALNAYYEAVAALENSQFQAAAPFLKETYARLVKSQPLHERMDQRYRSLLEKWDRASSQSDFLTVFVSWLQAWQLEQPKQN